MICFPSFCRTMPHSRPTATIAAHATSARATITRRSAREATGVVEIVDATTSGVGDSAGAPAGRGRATEWAGIAAAGAGIVDLMASADGARPAR